LLNGNRAHNSQIVSNVPFSFDGKREIEGGSIKRGEVKPKEEETKSLLLGALVMVGNPN